jgi:hypothetical protein
LSGSANSDDGTGQGDSGAGGGMVLYAEVNAGELVEGERRLESGVPGRKDRGDSKEFGEDDDDPL